MKGCVTFSVNKTQKTISNIYVPLEFSDLLTFEKNIYKLHFMLVFTFEKKEVIKKLVEWNFMVCFK